jgi:hypothetical protein
MPRTRIRAASVRMRGTAGIPRGPVEKPQPEIFFRTAADYLPPRLKAKLIAEGRLTADGTLNPAPPAQTSAGNTKPSGEQAAAFRGMLARFGRFFRKLF